MLENRKSSINSGDDFKLPKSYSIAITLKYQYVAILRADFGNLDRVKCLLYFCAGEIYYL